MGPGSPSCPMTPNPILPGLELEIQDFPQKTLFFLGLNTSAERSRYQNMVVFPQNSHVQLSR